MSEATGGSTLLTEGGAPPPMSDDGGNPEGADNSAGPDLADQAIADARNAPPEWAPQKFWDPNTRQVKHEDLGRAYINLEKLVGRDKVPVPLGDDDKEGWERFYNAAGRPEAPDKYEFKRPELPEDLPYDEDTEAAFREYAHINGLNKKQASAIYDAFVAKQIERHSAWTQHKTQERQQAEHALRREYGQQYDQAINSAKAAMMQYADPDFHQFLNETGTGNDPRMIRIFARIGKEMNGEQRLQGRPQQDVNPADLDRAIADFRSKNSEALHSKDHPDHALRVKEFNKLFEKRYGD